MYKEEYNSFFLCSFFSSPLLQVTQIYLTIYNVKMVKILPILKIYIQLIFEDTWKVAHKVTTYQWLDGSNAQIIHFSECLLTLVME